MTNKYNAKRVVYDIDAKEVIDLSPFEAKRAKKACYIFDSIFEFEVFKRLMSLYGKAKVMVHPKYTHPTLPMYFCPDFAIGLQEKRLIYESKGKITPEYPIKLALFLQAYPQFEDNYFLVFQTPKAMERAFCNRLLRHLYDRQHIEILTIDSITKTV